MGYFGGMGDKVWADLRVYVDGVDVFEDVVEVVEGDSLKDWLGKIRFEVKLLREFKLGTEILYLLGIEDNEWRVLSL